MSEIVRILSHHMNVVNEFAAEIDSLCSANR